MPQSTDVIIIGAGTAGLNAVKEVKKFTSRYLVIDQGPLGSTCSRVGCMPSKILLQLAHDCHRHKSLMARKIWNGNGQMDSRELMRAVRALRDHFVAFVLREIDELAAHFVQGHARFLGPDVLHIEGRGDWQARKIILAVGSTPVMPDEWKEHSAHILTTEQFFELDELPPSWGVIGLGPIGLEMGQALSWLGREIYGFDKKALLGGLTDPVVHEAAYEAFQASFPIHMNVEVKIRAAAGKLALDYGSGIQEVDKVLAALGRKPNFQGLDLKETGCSLDARGIPAFDSSTMLVKDSVILIAGDCDGKNPILHEASDDGRIAGYNARPGAAVSFRRKVRMGLTFTVPSLGFVGKYPEKEDDVVTGEVSFQTQGRSLIQGENQGFLRLFVDRTSGRLVAAEFAAPEGEHLCHLLAWAVQKEFTAPEMLRLPFYHPTVEEGLRSALRDAVNKLRLPPDEPTMPELEVLSSS